MAVKEHLEDLEKLKNQLAANLQKMGVAAHERENLKMLVPKVLLIPKANISETTLFDSAHDVWDKYDKSIVLLLNNGTYSLISFCEQFPAFCSEDTENMLNYSYEALNWGVELLTASTAEVSVNSNSRIIIEYKSGANLKSFVYFIAPDGRDSTTPIADYIFDKIKSDDCIKIPHEWLYSDKFVTVITSCSAIPTGRYYIDWSGISDNSHPLLKSVKILGGD